MLFEALRTLLAHVFSRRCRHVSTRHLHGYTSLCRDCGDIIRV